METRTGRRAAMIVQYAMPRVGGFLKLQGWRWRAKLLSSYHLHATHVSLARPFAPPAGAVTDRPALLAGGIRSRALSRNGADRRRIAGAGVRAEPGATARGMAGRRWLRHAEDRRAWRGVSRRSGVAGERARRWQMDFARRLGGRERHAVARGGKRNRAGIGFHGARHQAGRGLRSQPAQSSEVSVPSSGRCFSSARSPAASSAPATKPPTCNSSRSIELPELSTGRVTAAQIQRVYRHHLDRSLATEFD